MAPKQQDVNENGQDQHFQEKGVLNITNIVRSIGIQNRNGWFGGF